MPNAVVIVATVRALKYHGGAKKDQFSTPDAELVRKGLPNLEKHIENMKMFGFTPVVAINKFDTDSDEEIKVIDDFCKAQQVPMAVNESWAKGSEGAVALAEAVINEAKSCPSCFKPLYDKNWDVEKKISTIVTLMYGAKDVEYSLKARKDLQNIVSLGLDKLAVCMAKTQNSLSDVPELRGRPKDFTVNIREIEISSGAGFVVPIAGTIMRMPGLPAVPSAENIGYDDNGNVTGLF